MSNDTTLPINWIKARFGELCKVQGGNAFRSQDYQALGVPLVRIGNLISNEIAFPESSVFLPESFLAKFPGFVLNQGDVLIAMSGATTGKMGVFRHDGPALLNQRVGRFQFKEKITVDQRFAALLVEKIRDLVVKTAYGAAQPNISPSQIEEMEVPLPPFNEQRRIVATIEELFSDLDAGVAALKRAKANLKRYRASVLKAAVEGKLTEEWRAKHPAKEPASALLARILKERRQKWEADQLAKFAAAKKEPPKNWKEKYVEPTPPDTTGLQELPTDWCWASVDQICDVGTGTTPSRANAGYYENGSVPWIMSGAVNHPFVDEASEFVTELALQETTLRLYPKGTLILALYGEGKTRGMVSELRIEATVNQALGTLVFSSSAISIQPFVKVFLTSNYVQLRRQAAGGMQPNLNLGIVKQIAIPFPPISEQAPIVAEVASRVSQIDSAETSIEHDLVRADRLRQSILKQAFEGKLVPQDPKDEPASVLLERLRASRAHDEANGTAATSKRTRGKIKESSGEPRTRIRRGPSSQNQQEE